MLEQVEAVDVVNEILMMRNTWDGAVCIVEGGADARLLGRIIYAEALYVARGKQTVMEAVTIARTRGVSYVVGVVDRDEWSTLGVPKGLVNIFTTEQRDLEVMILESNAFCKVLTEFGSSDKLAALADGGFDPLDVLREATEPLGCLRLVSYEQGLNLRFKELSFGKFMSRSLEVDAAAMCKAVKDHSSRPDLDVETLVRQVDEARQRGFERRDICAGHDLVQVLALALQKRFGTLSSKALPPPFLERVLIAAFEDAALVASSLVSDLRKWAATDGGWALFRDY